MSKENDISWVKKLRENDCLETKTAPLIHQKDKTTIVIESPKPEQRCSCCQCCFYFTVINRLSLYKTHVEILANFFMK